MMRCFSFQVYLLDTTLLETCFDLRDFGNYSHELESRPRPKLHEIDHVYGYGHSPLAAPARISSGRHPHETIHWTRVFGQA